MTNPPTPQQADRELHRKIIFGDVQGERRRYPTPDELLQLITHHAQQARLEERQSLKAQRLNLDRRIHNQRVALRENWMIVEQRRGSMFSGAILRRYIDTFVRLHAEIKRLRGELDAIRKGEAA